MDKQLLDKDSSSISQSLFQVLAVIKNNDFVRTDGAAMALTSSIIWSLLGHFFSQKQDNSDHQTQENDLQESAVNYRFNFSTTKLRTTEQQSMSVSMSDACSEEWDPVAFSSFMQSIPFFTLFTICANSYQSRLLGFASMKGILEAKISELPSDSFNFFQYTTPYNVLDSTNRIFMERSCTLKRAAQNLLISLKTSSGVCYRSVLEWPSHA